LPEAERHGNMRSVLVESDRQLIRRPEEGDGRRLERVFCDPAMMRYLGGAWTPHKVAEALQEWRGDWGVDNRWYGVLVRKDTLQAISTAGSPRSRTSFCALPLMTWEQRGCSRRLTQTTLRPTESSRSSVSSVSASGATRMTTCPASTHRFFGNRPAGAGVRGLLTPVASRVCLAAVTAHDRTPARRPGCSCADGAPVRPLTLNGRVRLWCIDPEPSVL